MKRWLVELCQEDDGLWVSSYRDGPDVATIGNTAVEALANLAKSTEADAKYCGGIEAIPMLRDGKRVKQ